jgi:hypothetical protein
MRSYSSLTPLCCALAHTRERRELGSAAAAGRATSIIRRAEVGGQGEIYQFTKSGDCTTVRSLFSRYVVLRVGNEANNLSIGFDRSNYHERSPIERRGWCNQFKVSCVRRRVWSAITESLVIHPTNVNRLMHAVGENNSDSFADIRSEGTNCKLHSHCRQDCVLGVIDESDVFQSRTVTNYALGQLAKPDAYTQSPPMGQRVIWR